MLSHHEAHMLLLRSRRDRRKIGNSTYLERRDLDDIAVRLHNTDVVTLHADGTYTLRTGGWRTVTTKARINEYSPVRVFQEDFTWYYGPHEIFVEGLRVGADGKPVSPQL